MAACYPVITLGKKISVFKITEQCQIQNNACRQKEPTAGFRFAIMDPFSPEVVAANSKEQQRNENPASFEIKKQTHQEQVCGS